MFYADKADQIRHLRVLCYAAAKEPMSARPKGLRAAALESCLSRKLVKGIGERGRTLLLELTDEGRRELALLKQLCPEYEDFASSAAARRATRR